MSYVLGLCFLYHRYQRDAVMRVYADDHLIDEVRLTQSIKFKIIDKSKFALRQMIGPMNYVPVIHVPEKLFLYEVQERYLNDHIKIDVQNDDNNYNNAFMTDYSYIRFENFFLIPDWLMYSMNWRRINRISSMIHKHNCFPVHPTSAGGEFLRASKKINDTLYRYPIGGSFTVKLPLYRKHNLMHLGKPKPGKIYINHEPMDVLRWFNVLNINT